MTSSGGSSNWRLVPDGATLAGTIGKQIGFWNAETGEPNYTTPLGASHITSAAFSPDGVTLASLDQGNVIRTWIAESGAHEHDLIGHTNEVTCVAYSLDGATLASGSDDNTIRLWDAVTGELKRTLEGHTSRIYSVAFSPDGATLASGSDEGTVLLWYLAPFPNVDSTVSITPSLATSPSVGEQMTISLHIAEGIDVVGYQASISFSPSALQYVEAVSGDYLPADSFFVPPVIGGDRVTLGGTAFGGAIEGDGRLATLTF